MSEENAEKVVLAKWKEIAIVVILAVAGAFGLEYVGMKEFIGQVFGQVDGIVEENAYYIEKIEGGVVYLRDRFGNRKAVIEIEEEDVEGEVVEEEE